MGKYRKASHCTYDCRYHIVWITKYRRKWVNKEIEADLKTILENICKEMYINIIKLGMEEDHIHMYVSIPTVQPLSYVMQKLKGVSSKKIKEKYGEYLNEYYWKQGVGIWAVGYFVATVGEVTHDIISKYVENQGREDVLGEEIVL